MAMLGRTLPVLSPPVAAGHATATKEGMTLSRFLAEDRDGRPRDRSLGYSGASTMR